MKNHKFLPCSQYYITVSIIIVLVCIYNYSDCLFVESYWRLLSEEMYSNEFCNCLMNVLCVCEHIYVVMEMNIVRVKTYIVIGLGLYLTVDGLVSYWLYFAVYLFNLRRHASVLFTCCSVRPLKLSKKGLTVNLKAELLVLSECGGQFNEFLLIANMRTHFFFFVFCVKHYRLSPLYKTCFSYSYLLSIRSIR